MPECSPLGCDVLGRQPRFDATTQVEARTEERVEIISVRVHVFANEAAAAADILERCMPAEHRLERVQYGNDKVSSRREDACELDGRRAQFRDVRERESAHNAVEHAVLGGDVE